MTADEYEEKEARSLGSYSGSETDQEQASRLHWENREAKQDTAVARPSRAENYEPIRRNQFT